MEDVATTLNMDPLTLKRLNLYQPGAVTPYKQPLPYFPIATMLDQLIASSVRLCGAPVVGFPTHFRLRQDYTARKAAIDAYNAANRWTKRGIAFVPSRFNVNNSFENLGVLLSVFSDGTIQVCTGGIDMGQGLHTKTAQAVAMKLGLPDTSLIDVVSASTLVNPNGPTTGGSVGSENSVMAAMNACDLLLAQLAPFKTKTPNATWPQLCMSAVLGGCDLRVTARANIAVPSTPDTYQTYGCAIVETYLDCLTGEYHILQSDVLVDLGISMNPLLDVGQVEGAYLMGIGLATCEEVVFNADGTLATNDTWEYKVRGVGTPPLPSSRLSLRSCADSWRLRHPDCVKRYTAQERAQPGRRPALQGRGRASRVHGLRRALFVALRHCGCSQRCRRDGTLPAQRARHRGLCTQPARDRGRVFREQVHAEMNLLRWHSFVVTFFPWRNGGPRPSPPTPLIE